MFETCEDHLLRCSQQCSHLSCAQLWYGCSASFGTEAPLQSRCLVRFSNTFSMQVNKRTAGRSWLICFQTMQAQVACLQIQHCSGLLLRPAVVVLCIVCAQHRSFLGSRFGESVGGRVLRLGSESTNGHYSPPTVLGDGVAQTHQTPTRKWLSARETNSIDRGSCIYPRI